MFKCPTPSSQIIVYYKRRRRERIEAAGLAWSALQYPHSQEALHAFEAPDHSQTQQSNVSITDGHPMQQQSGCSSLPFSARPRQATLYQQQSVAEPVLRTSPVTSSWTNTNYPRAYYLHRTFAEPSTAQNSTSRGYQLHNAPTPQVFSGTTPDRPQL